MSRINWNNFDLFGTPSLAGTGGFRVFIVYKPKPAWQTKDGRTVYEVQDKKEVTDKFEALIGAYFEQLEKEKKVIVFQNAGLVVLTLGTIEGKLRQIKDLAEEIIDNGHCYEDVRVAEEIVDLVDELLKMKEG